MAWTLSGDQLVAGVGTARGRVDERRRWTALEPLARALRWIDKLGESRSCSTRPLNG